MSLENILLGLLQKPASGYDLKATFDNAIRYFWSAELSQIYTTLKRMERGGLVTGRTEPSSKGPDRNVYRITPAGRKQLSDWLLEEPQIGEQRLIYLAQLYFMSASEDPSRSLWFVSDLRRTFVERLRAFRQIEAEWQAEHPGCAEAADDDCFHQYLTLRMGILVTEARVRWCDETTERIRCRVMRKPAKPKKKKGSKR